MEVDEIKSKEGKGFFYKCDVRDALTVDATIDNVIKKFKKIDILINNAGIVIGKSFLDINFSEIKDVIGTLLSSNYMPDFY